MKTRNSPSSSESLALDDASTLESAGSGSPLVHGLAVDTISRSVPTSVLPLYVRESLFRAWPGMNGNVVRGSRTTADEATASLIPWYSYDTQGGNLVESVAERLTVDSQDAELWFQRGLGRFGNYADMPLNDAAIERLAFWRYDPDANEFDPSMMLEPQVYAHDQLSQLFTECCSFHFGYLADIDAEYHRLRSGGVVAQYDEDGVEYEPWYRLYHYWRNVIEMVYLGLGSGNPQIRLPQHLRNGNWRIKDVLDELEARLTGTGGFIHNDIIVTGKGYTRGLQTVTLGLQPDAKYLDGDGNSRFYLPYLQRASTTDLSYVGLSLDSAYQTTSQQPAEGEGELFYSQEVNSEFSTTATATGEVAIDELSVGPMWSAYASIIAAASGTNSLPLWNIQLNGALDLATNVDFFGEGAVDQGRVFTGLDYIYPLPINGQLTVGAGSAAVDYNYWTGHCLNLFEFIEFMRYVGQSTEPEVIDKLLVPMGIVVAVDAFKVRPSGASCNHLDELYNLYESQSSFNENPARKFTAAHLGPTQHVIPSDQTDPRSLSLRGNVLSTTDSAGNLLTARERYWTPGSLDTGTANQVAAAFLPGVVLKTTLYPNLDIENLAAVDDNTLREFISRALGTVGSMRTKVEKPVFLPAGKTGPESTYASGVGIGALQLVYEVLYALSGGKPRFGLGYGGFSDVNMAELDLGDEMPVWWQTTTRAEAQDLNSAIVAFNQASDLNALIDAIFELGYPGPSDILSAGLSDAIDGSVIENKYKAAFNWNASRTNSNAIGNPEQGFGRGAAEEGLLADHADSFDDPATSAFWRRLSVSPSHYVAQSTRGAGSSAQIQKFALPHAVEWGMPVMNTTSTPDMASALVYEGIHYSGRATPAANQTWQDGSSFWRIDVIPERIEMFTSPAAAGDGSAPLRSVNLVSATDGTIYRPASDLAGAGIATIISDRLNIPYQAFVDPDHGNYIAHCQLANIWNTGTIGHNFQVHGFDAATHTSGVQVSHEQMPFTTNRTLLRPSELIRTYGADMWSEWFTGAATADQLPLNAVGFRLHVGVYVVDSNASGQSAANVPAVGSCSQAQGVWRLGHSEWQMGILDRSSSLPSLTQGIIGVTADGTFTPAFVGQSREVSLNANIDWNAGSHVTFYGSTWTADPEYTAWQTSRGALREWAFDYITDWSYPAHSGTALDYSIWQSFATAPDHPVSRMYGTWSSMKVDASVDGNKESLFVDALCNDANSWQQSLFPGNYMNLTPLAHPSPGTELAYWNFASARGSSPHGSYPTWHDGSTIINNGGDAFTTAYSNAYRATHVLGRNSGSRLLSFGPTAMVDSTSGRSIDCIHNFNRFGVGENWGNYFGSMAAFADEAFACLTYVYPDLPSYKMRFRPFRRIADATLMMEQKLTFMNDGEDVSPLAGPLGIKVIGTPTQFRFADLVDAGQPETYLLEPVRTRTRLIDPSHRSVLTFTKLALLDEDSQTHTIPDVVMAENQKAVTLGNKHASGATSSSKVYNRNTIRDIQLGRQFQRLN